MIRNRARKITNCKSMSAKLYVSLFLVLWSLCTYADVAPQTKQPFNPRQASRYYPSSYDDVLHFLNQQNLPGAIQTPEMEIGAIEALAAICNVDLEKSELANALKEYESVLHDKSTDETLSSAVPATQPSLPTELPVTPQPPGPNLFDLLRGSSASSSIQPPLPFPTNAPQANTPNNGSVAPRHALPTSEDEIASDKEDVGKETFSRDLRNFDFDEIYSTTRRNGFALATAAEGLLAGVEIVNITINSLNLASSPDPQQISALNLTTSIMRATAQALRAAGLGLQSFAFDVSTIKTRLNRTDRVADEEKAKQARAKKSKRLVILGFPKEILGSWQYHYNSTDVDRTIEFKFEANGRFSTGLFEDYKNRIFDFNQPNIEPIWVSHEVVKANSTIKVMFLYWSKLLDHNVYTELVLDPKAGTFYHKVDKSTYQRVQDEQ